jgi:hypothetical protein
VLTRSKHHWSQLLSDDNPRGYSEKQKQKIADADTLVKKRGVELKVMMTRLNSEIRMKESIDEYGMDRINAMIADINAQYAAMGLNVGITHDASAVGTEGYEDVEEEESDSDHEPRSLKRYVYLSIYMYAVQYIRPYMTIDIRLFLFHAISYIFNVQTQSQHRCFPATGQQQPLEPPCHRRQPTRLR